ncbi:hypothetical protein OQA88_8424 [Cercophora sp. LCS_1]
MRRFIALCIHVLSFLSFVYAQSDQFVLFPYFSGGPDEPVDMQNGFGNTTEIPAACASALNSTIHCNERIRGFASENVYMSLNGTDEEICSDQCTSSLVHYHQIVSQSCQGINVFNGAPNTWMGDVMWAWVNSTCTYHTTGEPCPDWLIRNIEAHAGDVERFEDLPTDVLCSGCMVNFWIAKQRSPYSNYDEENAETWAEIQTKCGISHPTAVPEPAFANPVLDSIPGTTEPLECLSGTTYAVQSGDTCLSIAAAKSVGSGALRVLNAILPDCSNLMAGAQICLPRPCQTYEVQYNETCATIAMERGLNDQLLIAWNPTINADCSNPDLPGSIICVSSPYETYEPSTIPGAIPTQTSPYATETVAPPGLTGPGTTLHCGKWVQVQEGDTCFALSLANGIELSLFMSINPAINAECDNLLRDLFYCVRPTESWSYDTTGTISSGVPSPTALPPPGPTPSGTTSQCARWHLVVSGDSCYLITQSFGISQADFTAWNPSVGQDCLIMTDFYYCVQGLPFATATSAAPTTTAPPPAPTCTQTYAVVSGDYCYKIWTDHGLTEAQFRGYNPGLDCDALAIGQVLCVGMSGAATTSVSAPTVTPGACLASYTVVAGDYCWKIWTDHGIGEADLRGWNPGLDCDALWVGQVLCVSK